MKIKVNDIVRIAVIAALYATFTIVQGDLAFLGIQFRVAEVFNLLAFINPIYGMGVILGCFLSNLYSPIIMDMVFGTLATALSVFFISRSKNIFIASLYPVIINAIIIGFELYFAYQLPLILTIIQVATGEFIVVCIIGNMLFRFILKNKALISILGISEKHKEFTKIQR